jgi:glucose-1-phosphate thymidylyltransferase
MKGLILAGGNGTRLRPLTDVCNKSLLPVQDKLMIHWPLTSLLESGINDICIVANSHHADQFAKALGNGEQYGIDLTWKFQKYPTGICGAIKKARNWVGDDHFCVILGDTILSLAFEKDAQEFEKQQKEGCRIFAKWHHDISWCAQIKTTGHHGSGKILDIVEKPGEKMPGLAAIGLYMYDHTAWQRIENLKPSDRNELEITDLNKSYWKDGKMSCTTITGTWHDAGTDLDAYKEAQKLYITKR